MNKNEESLEGLDHNQIKVNKIPSPQKINQNSPPLYFSMMAIRQKGSGKFYSIEKLLKLYEHYPLYDYEDNKLNFRVILFHRTLNSDIRRQM
jgi:hypothetical protein